MQTEILTTVIVFQGDYYRIPQCYAGAFELAEFPTEEDITNAEFNHNVDDLSGYDLGTIITESTLGDATKAPFGLHSCNENHMSIRIWCDICQMFHDETVYPWNIKEEYASYHGDFIFTKNENEFWLKFKPYGEKSHWITVFNYVWQPYCDNTIQMVHNLTICKELICRDYPRWSMSDFEPVAIPDFIFNDRFTFFY